ncbi:MAG: hypothetical protein Q9217_006366 [Psora testacea]
MEGNEQRHTLNSARCKGFMQYKPTVNRLPQAEHWWQIITRDMVMAKRKRSETHEDAGENQQGKKVKANNSGNTQSFPFTQGISAESKRNNPQPSAEDAREKAIKLDRRKARHQRRALRKLQQIGPLKQGPGTTVQRLVGQNAPADSKFKQTGMTQPPSKNAKVERKALKHGRGHGGRDQDDKRTGEPYSMGQTKGLKKVFPSSLGGPEQNQIKAAKVAQKKAKRRERATRKAQESDVYSQDGNQEQDASTLQENQINSNPPDKSRRKDPEYEPDTPSGSLRDEHVAPDGSSISQPDTNVHGPKHVREQPRRKGKAKKKAESNDSASLAAAPQTSESLQAPAANPKIAVIAHSPLIRPSSKDPATEPAAKEEERRKEGKKARKRTQNVSNSTNAIKMRSRNGDQDIEFARREKLQSQWSVSAVKVGEAPASKEESVIRTEEKRRKFDMESSPKIATHEGLSWSLSEPRGGQMLDIDPIFSGNEEYLLIAYHTYVAIYSTATSLMVRKLPVAEGDRVAAITLSPSKPDRLFVAATSGCIELWDWLEGVKLTQWAINGRLHSLTAIQQSNDSRDDLIFVTSQTSDNAWQLSVVAAQGAENCGDVQNHVLSTQQQPLTSVWVADDAKVIIMYSGPQLTIGTSPDPRGLNLGDLKYIWRTITCPEWISCVDIRAIQDSNQKQKAHAPSALSPVDVVIGGLRGSIHIYEDLLNRLVDCEKASQKGRSQELTSRRLHWHRNAVLAVKWSSDGNYLISGGNETVLILWQLDSGRKETLPHLGAPIESIVVSPRGSSYAIRLADNSAMIVSTSEMRPFFSVSGIQLPGMGYVRNPLPPLPSVDNMDLTTKHSVQSSLPACVSPSEPGHLLFAVPPDTTSRTPSPLNPNASYLQTFDIGAAHSISRQALARTKTTNLNMGPESNTIEEPNVTHIATSHDGQWLATIDEWMPPRRDLTSLAFDRDREREEQIFRQEIYLRFWSWNDERKFWELVARIDNPHGSDSGNAYEGGRVLALALNPTSVGFATFGEDGALKTWRPTIRRRHGLEVKGKDGKALTNWHCHWSTSIESPDSSTAKNRRPDAHIAYSADGSVVAAGLQTPSPSPVYISESCTGQIQSIHTGLYIGPLLGLGILDRYLIILSGDIILWDLVNDELHYSIDLQLPTLSLAKLATSSHLAIDMQHNTFAVAVPEIKSVKQETKLKSQLAVFDPAKPEALFVESLPNAITALVPATGRKGYYAIDMAAEVRTLTPPQTLTDVSIEVPKVDEAPQRGLNGIFGNGAQERDGKVGLLIDKTKPITREPGDDEDDPVFVSQDKLAAIFDQAPAYALPPITELFEQVAGLFVGRPMATAAS